MGFLKSSFFAARLAWRQLIYDRAKFLAAILGVLFACVLVFMQLGFRDSLISSTGMSASKMQADIFLIHKQTEAIWRPVQFNRSILMRTLAHPDVAQVIPLYSSLAQFKNIDTRGKRTLMLYGYDPDTDLFNISEVIQQREEIRQQDVVLFDRLARPEFGPVPEWLKQDRNEVEINDHKVTISGLFSLGTTFSADGNVITSEKNFLRLFPGRMASQIDAGFIRLKPGSDVLAAQKSLEKLLNGEVLVLTHQEFIAHEQDYWAATAPVGFIFGFGVIMGLIVGMVIVYQILFTDISNNLSEYATLKAMGYSQGYLVQVVFASAMLLAIIGFIPGFFLSLNLYHLAESKIFIAFPMPPEKIISVFCFIVVMCMAAGALAIRKLKAADPADMF